MKKQGKCACIRAQVVSEIHAFRLILGHFNFKCFRTDLETDLFIFVGFFFLADSLFFPQKPAVRFSHQQTVNVLSCDLFLHWLPLLVLQKT